MIRKILAWAVLAAIAVPLLALIALFGPLAVFVLLVTVVAAALFAWGLEEVTRP